MRCPPALCDHRLELYPYYIYLTSQNRITLNLCQFKLELCGVSLLNTDTNAYCTPIDSVTLILSVTKVLVFSVLSLTPHIPSLGNTDIIPINDHIELEDISLSRWRCARCRRQVNAN
jgi:hypothetical protein